MSQVTSWENVKKELRKSWAKSFCASGKFLRVFTKLAMKWSLNINLRVNKFPDSLESFRTIWKVSGQSRTFPDSLESFRTVWKVSEQSEKFLDSLENFRTVWKVFEQSGKFPANPVNICTLSPMSRKQFTYFWSIYVVKAIYALSPESFCAWKSAKRKVCTFWVLPL